jgi:Tfp pilus assembly protein PilF
MHYLQPERAQPAGWEKAIEHLTQALELRPNDGFLWAHARLDLAMAHMHLAVHFHDAGQPERSEEQFALALRIEPDRAEPRTFYAAFLRLTGRLDEAAEQCHKALELQPDSPEARFELGLVLAERGRYAEAIDLLREALAAAHADEKADLAARIEVELRRCKRELAGDHDD